MQYNCVIFFNDFRLDIFRPHNYLTPVYDSYYVCPRFIRNTCVKLKITIGRRPRDSSNIAQDQWLWRTKTFSRSANSWLDFREKDATFEEGGGGREPEIEKNSRFVFHKKLSKHTVYQILVYKKMSHSHSYRLTCEW